MIDISNPFNDDYSDYTLPWDTSSAEVVQASVARNPRGRRVQACVLGGLRCSGVRRGPSDVLIVGNDASAKQRFLELGEGTPFRYLDAGPLIHARTLERLTLVTGRVGRESGYYPRMNWRLLGDSRPLPAGQDPIDRLIAGE